MGLSAVPRRHLPGLSRFVLSSPYAVIMMTGTSGRAALAFGNSSRPVIPGMLMSDRIRINDAAAASLISFKRAVCRLGKIHREATVADVAPECWRNSASTSGSSSTTSNKQAHLSAPCFARGCPARKDDLEFGEFTGRVSTSIRSGVLLDNNVVASTRRPRPVPSPGRLGRKETG